MAKALVSRASAPDGGVRRVLSSEECFDRRIPKENTGYLEILVQTIKRLRE